MIPRLSKPSALLELPPVLAKVYSRLRRTIDVPDPFSFSLGEQIGTVTEKQLADPVEVAAFTMRKLQLLSLIAQKEVLTTSDIVAGLCIEIVRSLNQLEGYCGPEAVADIRAARRDLKICAATVTTMHESGGVVELK
ncbi:hypothetical protein ACWKWC_02760 [Geodermatophilus nigrescens]